MDPTYHPNPTDYWRHRRRLAYASLTLATAETCALIVIARENTAALDALGAVIAWSYGVWGSTIAAYVGTAAWVDIRHKQQKARRETLD